MPYEFVLWAHASAVLTAIALFVVSEILLALARFREGPYARAALLASKVAGAAAGLGVLGGIALVYLGGWPLTTPWLLASLVLIAALMGVGRLWVSPWESRIRAALADNATRDAKALAADGRAFAGRVAVIALFVCVAMLMAMKPDIALIS